MLSRWQSRFTPRSRATIRKIGAFLTLSKERALAKAAEMDALAAKGEKLAAAGRRAGRNQRRDGHQGRSHYGGLENSRQLYSSLRLHCGGAAGGCRRGGVGQTELRRVCHGLVERELGLEAGAQSARSHSRSGRIVGGIGGGGGGGYGGGDAGLRYRRLDSPARFVLRRGWTDADLWAGFALWFDRVCLVARPHRAAGKNGEGRGDRAANHCRPRSHGFNFRRCSGSGLRRRVGEAGARAEDRRGQRVSGRGAG